MKLTGVIIAGGKSTRMGFDKSQIVYKGKSFLQNAIDLLTPFVDEIIISSNTITHPKYWVVNDSYFDAGPLGGIHASLLNTRTQKALMLPVDMPLLSRQAIELLLSGVDGAKQASIFEVQDRWQSLVGVYDVSLLPIIEAQLKKKDYKLKHLLQKSVVQLINGDRFAGEFVNVNSRDELAWLLNDIK